MLGISAPLRRRRFDAIIASRYTRQTTANLRHATSFLGLLALFVVIGLGLLLTSPGATPTMAPLADLESDLPRHFLATVQPVPSETIEAQLAPVSVARKFEVRKGDTLMKMLVRAGIERPEAARAIDAMREIYSPRALQVGQAVRLAFAPLGQVSSSPDEGLRLQSFTLQSSPEQDIRVVRDLVTDSFQAHAVERPLTREVVQGGGIIDSSLFAAGIGSGVPAPVMIEVIRSFSFDVDFQREIRRADDFELLYETHYDDDGRLAKLGSVIYAALTLSGRRVELYRFTPKSGMTDYFDAEGRSVRKALLRTPIDGARLSSGYGMRRHPVLGYTRMHRGLDFAAPTGTPIYAAGDGVIERVGRNGTYGKYVRIRHNSSYKTAYAHMSRFAKRLKKGTRVKQGQVIGYVGSTGRSTGPHLHYEVITQGKAVNPKKIAALPSGERLKGEDLAAFAALRQKVDRLREERPDRQQIVQAGCEGGLFQAEAETDRFATTRTPDC